ncbi:arp2 3 complex subunit [Zalerion maritima]|uniref:Actin-related protein 2/3 complex subunit 3 n=1 Tax=Zalerion maritima TaxID=339359 RepID=A0AAD5RLS7_9PEZI|nr:arp2 3 complex subunit [Zalerion maritima]
MPAYHVEDVGHMLADDNALAKTRKIANIPLLYIRGYYLSAEPYNEINTGEDIVDEALKSFRSNIFFRNFASKGLADNLLMYCTWFISTCLTIIKPQHAKRHANRALNNLLDPNFPIPGDPDFPDNTVFNAKPNEPEAGELRKYLGCVKEAMIARLLEMVYTDPDGNEMPGPSKWWMSYSKRKFLGKGFNVHPEMAM